MLRHSQHPGHIGWRTSVSSWRQWVRSVLIGVLRHHTCHPENRGPTWLIMYKSAFVIFFSFDKIIQFSQQKMFSVNCPSSRNTFYLLEAVNLAQADQLKQIPVHKRLSFAWESKQMTDLLEFSSRSPSSLGTFIYKLYREPQLWKSWAWAKLSRWALLELAVSRSCFVDYFDRRLLWNWFKFMFYSFQRCI